MHVVCDMCVQVWRMRVHVCTCGMHACVQGVCACVCVHTRVHLGTCSVAGVAPCLDQQTEVSGPEGCLVAAPTPGAERSASFRWLRRGVGTTVPCPCCAHVIGARASVPARAGQGRADSLPGTWAVVLGSARRGGRWPCRTAQAKSIGPVCVCGLRGEDWTSSRRPEHAPASAEGPGCSLKATGRTERCGVGSPGPKRVGSSLQKAG